MDHLKSQLFGRHLGFYHLKTELFASLDCFIYKHKKICFKNGLG